MTNSTATGPSSPATKPTPPDWNTRYLQGDIPWDQPNPARELERVLRDWSIRPTRTLEMGCGTGVNAVHLARKGFAVTAFDIAPRAIEIARGRAERAGVSIDYHAGDFRQLDRLEAPFDLLFDCGFYHCVRRDLLSPLLGFLERMTRPGSLWLSLVGNANDPQPREKGPPRLRAAELCAELEPLFSLVELREASFDATSVDPAWKPLAWSALWRRR